MQKKYRQESEATQHYFSRFSCYLERQAPELIPRIHRSIIELYTSGIRRNAIFRYIRNKHKYKFSYWHFYYNYFPKLQSKIEAWNRTNPHGMDFIADISPT